VFGLLRRMTPWWGLVTLAAIAAVAATVAQSAVGHEVLRRVGLLERPAAYTSLGFQNPRFLVEKLASKRANVGISFVIHNAGSDSRKYQWSVLLVEKGHARRVAVGDARVIPGHSVAVTRSEEISCVGGRVQVVVRLASPAEVIDSWIACPSSRS
jgi:hypothetical protein